MKLIELIAEQEKQNQKWFSLEFYPYKTTDGVHNLFHRAERMTSLQPLFADVTWGAGGTTADMSLEITAAFQNYICLETQMHLTCTNMEVEMFENALNVCRAKHIQNILALRGDPPRGQEKWTAIEGGFEHAIDLVKFIRQKHGNHFGISVAGYPEGHIESESYEKDLQHLKAKVEAGADLIITQLFYDVNEYFKFVKDCRSLGITCPIIPGIMPITSYVGLGKIVEMCKTKVPQSLWDALEPVKDDAAQVRVIGQRFVTEMCAQILSSGVVSGLHMYTMNQEEGVRMILESLSAFDLCTHHGKLPWRAPVLEHRQCEDVRPIFWANRPKSYLVRTKEWDSFPTGRWGDNRSPAYGDPGNWHSLPPPAEMKQSYAQMWGGELNDERDVFKVFCDFIEGKINILPWNEVPLREESRVISTSLLSLNTNGFLTINSQPRLNACSSDHPEYGWGAPGGHVYQKGYVECFASASRAEALVEMSDKYPSLTIYAINIRGEEIKNKRFSRSVNAVTWGIFPNSEVLQPTVVDPASVVAWKDEAFSLWAENWASMYDPESCSFKVLNEMIQSYYLVTVVDNDFISGNVFAVFEDVIATLGN